MNVVCLLTSTLVLATALSAFGQTPVVSPPTPLSQLLAEAEGNNPQISAADHGARAARQMVPQVSTPSGGAEAKCSGEEQRSSEVRGDPNGGKMGRHLLS